MVGSGCRDPVGDHQPPRPDRQRRRRVDDRHPVRRPAGRRHPPSVIVRVVRQIRHAVDRHRHAAPRKISDERPVGRQPPQRTLGRRRDIQIPARPDRDAAVVQIDERRRTVGMDRKSSGFRTVTGIEPDHLAAAVQHPHPPRGRVKRDAGGDHRPVADQRQRRRHRSVTRINRVNDDTGVVVTPGKDQRTVGQRHAAQRRVAADDIDPRQTLPSAGPRQKIESLAAELIDPLKTRPPSPVDERVQLIRPKFTASHRQSGQIVGDQRSNCRRCQTRRRPVHRHVAADVQRPAGDLQRPADPRRPRTVARRFQVRHRRRRAADHHLAIDHRQRIDAIALGRIDHPPRRKFADHPSPAGQPRPAVGRFGRPVPLRHCRFGHLQHPPLGRHLAGVDHHRRRPLPPDPRDPVAAFDHPAGVHPPRPGPGQRRRGPALVNPTPLIDDQPGRDHLRGVGDQQIPGVDEHRRTQRHRAGVDRIGDRQHQFALVPQVRRRVQTGG